MFQKIEKKLASIPIIYLAFVTLWLRFVYLGYSDYQGDEIKALFFPQPDQSFIEFLFDQRKGPLQFLVTYVIKIFEPLYLNRYFVRFPFAFAGVLSVLLFYFVVKMNFDKKIALYSSLFFSMNGLLVAFSRIVQYQSFTILFFMLALFFFTLAVKTTRWNIAGLYFGMFFWGISALAHYDAIFIAPAVLYLLYNWWKKNIGETIKFRLLHIAFPILLCGTVVASFYAPFFNSVSGETLDYWTNRLSGGEGKVSSSVYTFKVYNPKYVFYIFVLLAALSLPKLIKRWWLVVWLLFPLVFMEVVTKIPGTHIYTYFIPLTLIASYGVTVIESIVSILFGDKVGKTLNVLGLSILFVFMFLLSNKVFVDHTYEYPWEHEKFLFWELRKPNAIYHLSMFGFPYYRHWDEIGKFVMTAENNGFYSTNERKSISRYHIQHQKDTDSAGHYVVIINPQSFTPTPVQEKVVYWMQHYDPVKVFENDGRIVAEIYYMPEGNLDTIKLLGY